MRLLLVLLSVCSTRSSLPSLCAGPLSPSTCSSTHGSSLAGVTLTGEHDTARGEWQNQDAFLVHPDCANRGVVLIGVFDGHGSTGEHVSAELASTLRTRADGLCAEIDEIMRSEACNDQSECQILLSGVLHTLSTGLEAGLDRHHAQHGGSTGVILVIAPGSYSITANVGDSRAVAVQTSSGIVTGLSRDHDICSSPHELQRLFDLPTNHSKELWHAAMQRHNSHTRYTWRVTDSLHQTHLVEQHKLVDEEGWTIVTQEHSVGRCVSFEFAPREAQQPPTSCIGRVGVRCRGGLRMTRAFGDWHIKAEVATLTHNFEGTKTQLGAATVIVASDGLWECLHQVQIAQRVLLLRGFNASAAQISRNLTAWAAEAWRDWEGPGERDDIAVVVLLLDGSDVAGGVEHFETGNTVSNTQGARASHSKVIASSDDL